MSDAGDIVIFDPPVMEPVETGVWRLVYDWTIVYRGECYQVYQGTQTDGASIPRALWLICGQPMQTPRLYAALVHDFLYAGGDPEATRKDADDLFRDLCIALGVPKWRAYVEWAALRAFGGSHWQGARDRPRNGQTKPKNGKAKTMKKIIIIAALAATFGVALTGCQTRVTATKNAEVVTILQDGTPLVTSGGWEFTARSPLYAAEALDGFSAEVCTNGTVKVALNKYTRDTSTNAVVMVREMFSGGAQLVEQIGVTYAKIAGGGAQADTVTAVASKVYSAFTTGGGDASKATVTADETAKTVTVTDGSVCTTCDASGNCTTGECSKPATAAN